MHRRAPATRHTVSATRPHLKRIPIPSPSSFTAPSGSRWRLTEKTVTPCLTSRPTLR